MDGSDPLSAQDGIGPPTQVLLDALPFIAFVSSAQGANLFVNSYAQSFTGLPEEVLLGEGWANLIHHDDRQQLVDVWTQALEAFQPFEMEGRLRRVDGAFRWFRTRVVPLRGASSQMEFWLGISTEIHDLKVAEAKAREAEEWMRLAQEASGVGTFEWDAITHELRWSAECKAIFGCPMETAATDELFLARLHPGDRERVLATIDEVFDPSGSGSYRCEYRAMWPDGSVRHVEARGRAIFDHVVGRHRAVRLIGTVRDVTEMN